MKKFFTFLSFTMFPLLLVVVADQWTKAWAKSLWGERILGPFKIYAVENHGALLGYFSHLPLAVKEVSFVTIGTFIFAVYLSCLWLLPIKSRATLIGLSLLVGGILGNVIDRFTGFVVTDFITLNINRPLPYMNLADCFQWVGYTLIAKGVYSDSRYYWPANDWRNKFIVNIRFQLRASLLISMMTFLSSATVLVFSYAFLKGSSDTEAILNFFALGFLVSAALSLAAFLAALVLTHRVAGPIYAITRHLKMVRKGTIRPLQLREYDEFKEIEKEVNALTEEVDVLMNSFPAPMGNSEDKAA